MNPGKFNSLGLVMALRMRRAQSQTRNGEKHDG